MTVFDTEEGLFLADGHHRVAADQRLGRTVVKAEVRRGSRQDALRFAVALAQDQRGLTESEVIDAIRRRSGDRWGKTGAGRRLTRLDGHEGSSCSRRNLTHPDER